MTAEGSNEADSIIGYAGFCQLFYHEGDYVCRPGHPGHVIKDDNDLLFPFSHFPDGWRANKILGYGGSNLVGGQGGAVITSHMTHLHLPAIREG
ncbi:hypothetical protein ES703_116396 [subsurface metagenome]